MPDPLPAAPRRVEFLDGLRGVAAVTVFFYHFLWTFIGLEALKDLIHHTSILINGIYAVYIFFVLSGFVLAQSSAKLRSGLMVQVIVRYFRLMIPMMASLLVALLWGHLFPSSLAHIPSFGQVFQDGIWRVFRTGQSDINGPLWTLRFELLGSFLVYTVYRFYLSRFRMASFAIFGVFALTHAFWLAFFLGALIREAWAAGYLKIASWGWLAFAGGILLGFGNFGDYPYSVGSGLIVLSLFTSPVLQQFFASRLARFLGRISFGLYLLHAPILRTVTFCVPAEVSLLPRFFLILFFSLTATLILAVCFTLVLDEPLLRLLHKFKSRMEWKRDLPSKVSLPH